MNNPGASKEEYDQKVKEIEAIFNPIMQRVYQKMGGQPGGMPNFQGGPGGAGPQPGAGASGTSTGGAEDVE